MHWDDLISGPIVKKKQTAAAGAGVGTWTGTGFNSVPDASRIVTKKIHYFLPVAPRLFYWQMEVVFVVEKKELIPFDWFIISQR